MAVATDDFQAKLDNLRVRLSHILDFGGQEAAAELRVYSAEALMMIIEQNRLLIDQNTEIISLLGSMAAKR